MNKAIKKLTAVILAACMPGGILFAEAAEQKLVVNASFNGYATNEKPEDITVSSRSYYVTEYKEGEKGLLMYAEKKSSSLDFELGTLNDTFVNFDLKSGEKRVYGYAAVTSADGTEQKLLCFNKNGDVTAPDGKIVGAFGKNPNNYAVCYRAEEKCCDIYINGRLWLKDYRIKQPKVSSPSVLRFKFASDEGDGYVILDNINVYEGNKYINKFPVEACNDEVLDEPEIVLGAVVGSKTLFNETFNSGLPMIVAAQGNIIENYTEEDGNGCLIMEKKNGTDFHVSADNVASDSDYVVYDFRLKVLEPDSYMRVMLKDSAAQFQPLVDLGPDGELGFCSGVKKKISADKWYRVSIIADYYNRTLSAYLDGKSMGTAGIESKFAANGAKASIFRFHATIYTSFVSKRPTAENKLKFLLDDVRVYEGDELKDEFGAVEKNIDLTVKKSTFTSDASQKKLLQDCEAIHARSGVVFSGGEKKLMSSEPFEQNGVKYIPVAETAEAFGRTAPEVEGAVMRGGVEYAAAESVLKSLGFSYKTVPAEYNDGLYVLNAGFSVPESKTERQALNDYMFYLRPTAAQIKEYYDASPTKGVHPRIQATEEDFDRIRSEVKTNALKKRWSETILMQAEQLLGQEPVTYEVIGGRLLYTSRKVLSRMYCLGMAYQLTGDKRYSERAYTEMETVAAFSDWHPSHHLDPCEMAAAVAIGYDWMFDAFSDEQRAVIERGMYQNCFYDAWLAYQSDQSAMTNAATASNNHNIVCNGGILVGALAMLDVYPDVSEYLISNAIRGADIMMYHFAPSGAWYEGPHYWEYTMQYTAKFIATMQSVLNTDMGMLACEGLSTSADFILYMQSPISIYNYADGIMESIYSPEMLWLSNKYSAPDITKAYLSSTDGKIKDAEDAALALIWYNTDIEAGSIMLDIDKFYPDQGTITMRNSWDDSDPTFVGVHAGETCLDHSQLDGGSFIFDAYGIRWAKDLGMGDYNSEGYWDSSSNGLRWTHFRSRAESHNTIVINPDSEPDHIVNSYAAMEVIQSKPRGAVVTVDMSELLAKNVNSAKRGFFFTDNRQSLVIRDQIELNKKSTVYWFMMTDAEAEVNGNRITLTQNGQKLYVDYITNGSAEVSCETAAPLPSSPQPEPTSETANRLAIKINAEGTLNITVKLTPAAVDGSDVSEYDTDISAWSVPDGELPAAPMLDFCTVNGKTVSFGGKKAASYKYLEGTLSAAPEVTAYDERYDISIEQAQSLSEPAKITVYDKNDMTNYSVYLVSFTELKLPMTFDGKKSIPVVEITASETPQEENAPQNVLDSRYDTRWSAEGAGQWLVLELNEAQTVDEVGIAFHLGNARKTSIAINLSEDGVNYTEVYSGKSSGTTNDMEFYPAHGENVKYIRVDFHGNDSGAAESWNSPTEVVITSNGN